MWTFLFLAVTWELFKIFELTAQSYLNPHAEMQHHQHGYPSFVPFCPLALQQRSPNSCSWARTGTAIPLHWVTRICCSVTERRPSRDTVSKCHCGQPLRVLLPQQAEHPVTQAWLAALTLRDNRCSYILAPQQNNKCGFFTLQ